MALGLSIDANRYVDFVRGEPIAVSVLTSAPRIVVPFVVLAELRSGFLGGDRPRNNEKHLLEFLRSPGIEVGYADDATTHFYAEIAIGLRRAGTPIPSNDIWIAALTIQHGLALFTRDKHFDHVPRLARI